MHLAAAEGRGGGRDGSKNAYKQVDRQSQINRQKTVQTCERVRAALQDARPCAVSMRLCACTCAVCVHVCVWGLEMRILCECNC
jgi:hypothetical protein